MTSRAPANRAPTLLQVTTDGAAGAAGSVGVADDADRETGAGLLDLVERRQLWRLRRWGTVGALLMAIGSTSSYGAATPIPNPLDGLRVVGLLSRIGPAALACSYSGIGLLVLCWFLIGRLATPGRTRQLSRSQLTHTLAMWAVPFLFTPPIFSRDVYSYLGIGAMMQHGFDPYQLGPYDALGDGNPLAHQVDARWQHTSSPYGPAFLLIVRAIVAVTGNHVLLGVLLQRLVELVGVLLIVIALPRLARRCGVDPVSALWLGLLNPLLLFHLIAGGHNEALMLGCMLLGLEIGLSGAQKSASALPLRLVGGAALITVGVGIKATAALALAFLVVAVARERGGRWIDLLRVGVIVAGTAAVVFAALTVAAGVGLGWVHALAISGSVRSFLSVSTALAIGAGALGLLLGLGDHTDAIVDIMQPIGQGIAVLIGAWVLWRCWRPGRGGALLNPVQGLGLALGALVLLGSVIQPWYLLWAALPLAASTGLSVFRRTTVWLTVIFAVIIMPNGATIPVFTIAAAVVVGVVVVGVVLVLLSRSGLPTALGREHAPPDPPIGVGPDGPGADSQYGDEDVRDPLLGPARR